VARPPLPHSHWIEPERLLAGEHPAGDGDEATKRRLAKLIDAGVTCFFDLTEPAEKPSYEPLIAAAAAGRAVGYRRHPIHDHGVPESDAKMREILAALDGALAEGQCVYLHCRAGIGRTNLVAGCWIANAGGDGASALERLNRLWRANARARSWPSVPETADQAEFVRGWQLRRQEPAALKAPASAPAPTASRPLDLRDRVRGMLLGLAAGDALGHAVHGLPAGAWSDKTAMALCLADSLVSQDGNDAEDQVQRYREWQRSGLWSSTGRCVGISAATARALAAAQWSGHPFAGSHDPAHADAEPLAHIGPAVAWFHGSPLAAIEAAVNAARVTHQAPLVLDAARFLAALLAGALEGAAKESLLAPDFSPDPGAWSPESLRSPVREIAAGAWRGRRPRRMLRGKFAAIAALESALTAFDGGADLAGSLEAAAARPGDAQAAAAIVGQLAGAHYGANSLPDSMRASLARAAEIEALADRIVDGAPRARGA
jgi:ADP-ribosylglycohydrolase